MLGGYLRRRVHASWMAALSCGGVVCGVVAAYDVSSLSSIAWCLTGIAFCLTSIASQKVWLVPFAVIGGLLIGFWRGSIEQADIAIYQDLVGISVTVTGTVKEDVDKNKRAQLVLRLHDLKMGNKLVVGSIWVTSSDHPTIRRSDIVTINGKMSEGFGSFPASIYSARIQSVRRPQPGDVAVEVRDYFATGVRRAINDTQASLGLGYLVGQRRGLPSELDSALQAAGLTHIVVASGYNLTVLVRLSRRLFEKISKYLAFISSSAMILGFIAITGMSPSMSRAGLVAGLSLTAWYYGRKFHPLVLLPFAMAVTLLVQPSYAWGDLGWQLSFAAFAGVMILAPLVQAYFYGDTEDRAVLRIFIETMSATVATLPILLVSFGQFSVVAPLANMAILPLVPLAMLLTFIAGIGGLVVPIAARVVGFPAQMLLEYMTNTATFMGSLPWAVQELQVTAWMAVFMYGMLICACVYLQRVTKYSLWHSSIIE